ncbi:septal ring lytic transglycosylase RlpA family protein [Aromatoleum sp.]|uniref:septal ring lytic transglycosylase RlpA family protein n=1 Tax=Aromatoleum sp. TaxID=2307007 RepID=UPI002FCAB6F8
MPRENTASGPLSGSRSSAALIGAVVALALAACGSVPSRDVGQPGAQPSASRPAAPSSPTRGGAYYKDDGPGDDVPANLDDVPDAVPRVEPLHRFANRPYNVFGEDYVPATSVTASRERGRASWYGRRFHGKPTSSGEPYDMYGMTAAHPTLPIPSYARVTNPANGRSVVVRVNDRGPFHKNRIIDLSYTAAHRLGYVNAGSALVEVETIVPGGVEVVATATPVPPLPGRKQVLNEVPPDEHREREADAIERLTDAGAATSSVFRAGGTDFRAHPKVFLQLGTFSSIANAEGFLGLVRDEFESFADRLAVHDDGGRYRLHLGPFASADEARAEAGKIAEALKIRPFVVTR